MVRTPGFHPGNRGSNPRGVTISEFYILSKPDRLKSFRGYGSFFLSVQLAMRANGIKNSLIFFL